MSEWFALVFQLLGIEACVAGIMCFLACAELLPKVRQSSVRRVHIIAMRSRTIQMVGQYASYVPYYLLVRCFFCQAWENKKHVHMVSGFVFGWVVVGTTVQLMPG